jgi:hypothetical protein
MVAVWLLIVAMSTGQNYFCTSSTTPKVSPKSHQVSKSSHHLQQVQTSLWPPMLKTAKCSFCVVTRVIKNMIALRLEGLIPLRFEWDTTWKLWGQKHIFFLFWEYGCGQDFWKWLWYSDIICSGLLPLTGTYYGLAFLTNKPPAHIIYSMSYLEDTGIEHIIWWILVSRLGIGPPICQNLILYMYIYLCNRTPLRVEQKANIIVTKVKIITFCMVQNVIQIHNLVVKFNVLTGFCEKLSQLFALGLPWVTRRFWVFLNRSFYNPLLCDQNEPLVMPNDKYWPSYGFKRSRKKFF